MVIADKPPSLGGEFAGLADSMLRCADLSYPPLCITAHYPLEDEERALLLEMESLLGLPIAVEPLRQVAELDLLSPGILFVSGGDAQTWVTALGEERLGVAVLQAIVEGAMLFAINSAACALGYWVVEQASEYPAFGLNWLPRSIILPWLADPADSALVRELLSRPDPLYALGLAGGRILALGGEDQVELWGKGAPTLLLGSGWGLSGAEAD